MRRRKHTSIEKMESRVLLSAVAFTVDDSKSYLSITGPSSGLALIGFAPSTEYPLMPQSTGSLTAPLTGTVNADVEPGTLQILSTTNVPVEQSVAYAPDASDLAAYGGYVNTVDTGDIFISVTGLAFQFQSAVQTLVNGTFPSTNISTDCSSGTLYYGQSPFVYSASFTGFPPGNNDLSAPNAQYSVSGTTATLTIPISATQDGPVTSDGSTFYVDMTFSGEIVATAQITPVKPVITQAATATPSPVTGTTTSLSALATEAGSTLSYNWTTTGTPPAAVVFSNGGVGSTVTATFSKAGTYNFQVTATDSSNQTVQSSVSVVVQSTVTAVVVSPSPVTVAAGATKQFTASVTDQFGNAVTASPVWSVTGAGTIGSSTGLYSAGSSPGSATVKATVGTVSGTSAVTVASSGPVITVNPSAAPSPVTGTTANLSVTATDSSAITYTWSVVGTPPAAVTFSKNGSTTANTTVATFTKAGVYSLQVLLQDAQSQTVTGTLSVTVSQTPTTFNLQPNNPSVTVGTTQQFTAAVGDQFGNAITTEPTWSVSGGGTISATGLFTAGSTTGVYKVTSKLGQVSASTNVTVVAVVTPAIVVNPPGSQTATAGQSMLFSLGSFTASNTKAPYSVDIKWGDGSADTTFSATAAGTITAQTHTYTTVDPYQVSVIVKDANGITSNTATFNVTVSAAKVTPTLVVTPATSQTATTNIAKSFSIGSFTATGTTAPYAITITWGDGSANTTLSATAAGAIAAQTHTYVAAGTDQVSVVVKDANGVVSNTGTFNVSVANAVMPAIVVTPATSQTATTNTAKSFSIGSFAATGTTSPYAITIIWGDGSANTTLSATAAGTIAAQSHTYVAAGSDQVSIIVKDANGVVSDTGTFNVSVANAVTPAIVVTAAASQSATTNIAKSFSIGSFTATGTTAPYAITITWGDGSANTTLSATTAGTIAAQSHTYAAAGYDQVSIVVKDANGVVSNTGTFNVGVIDSSVTPAIVVTPSASESATVKTAKSFTIGSFTAVNTVAPYTVNIDWGDSTADTTFTITAAGTIPTQSHAFAKTGTSTVTVMVNDSNGTTSDPVEFTVTVGGAVAPTLTITPAASQLATAGTSKSFTIGSFTGTSTTAPYAVDISWGDGSADTKLSETASGAIAAQNHTYAKAGSDTVTLTVTDKNGITGKATFSVAVSAVAVNKGTITGSIFKDANANGKKDSNEAGLSGIKVYLDTNKNGTLDSGEISTTTTSSGEYEFTGLAPGSYRVSTVNPGGYYVDSPSANYADVSVATATTAATGPVFAYEPKTASISGTVFNDINGNGKQDSGEKALAGFEVYIDVNKDGKYDSGDFMVTSNSSGIWSFGDLIAGTYQIRIVPLSGYSTTTAGGTLKTITVAVGQAATGELFGEKKA